MNKLNEHIYLGVKCVTAWVEEKNGKEGYGIKYPDGYISWCPKEAFEKYYFKISRNDKLCEEDIDNFINRGKINVEQRNDKSTLVEVLLPNGWIDWEVSSCINPDNYDTELGKKYALENIKHRVWKSLGFVLQWAYKGLK